ncbi:MAG: PepSY domain-containing protein [Planctomycetaceae bacterium]
MSLKSWPDYRAVWRWHFYAGLFCIPFVIVLSVSGLIYLFKPQIEAWNDRAFDSLTMTGQQKPVSEQIAAAIAAVPGSSFSSYELPQGSSSAARIVVKGKSGSIRTCVHPETLQILHTVPEDERFMRWIFRLHGELLMGDRGSNLVELAACWTIVLLISGLYLWWPRNAKGIAGVLYPRLFGGSRMFWRDIHSVVGMWISFLAMFLLITGLPWAKFWGDYFKQVRHVTGTAVAQQDWSNSSSRPNNSGSGDHAEHGGAAAGGQRRGEGGAKKRSDAPPINLAIIDTMVANVTPLKLDPPVIISAPGGRSKTWSAKSNTANRPRRVTIELDPKTGAMLGREDFKDKHWIDQAVGFGIAAHEGALFGLPNLVLGVVTTLGLILLSVSGIILWWKRRDQGVLGAPKPALSPRLSWGLISIILVIGICLPLFAGSLAVVLLAEWLLLRRIPGVRTWLGLRDIEPSIA